jgi:hypothetical protein
MKGAIISFLAVEKEEGIDEERQVGNQRAVEGRDILDVSRIAVDFDARSTAVVGTIRRPDRARSYLFYLQTIPNIPAGVQPTWRLLLASPVPFSYLLASADEVIE